MAPSTDSLCLGALLGSHINIRPEVMSPSVMSNYARYNIILDNRRTLLKTSALNLSETSGTTNLDPSSNMVPASSLMVKLSTPGAPPKRRRRQ
ncbi:predicted protein [Uncinocarpus reesii 1704]|uniref:Uncharacterized protein n=1 Tax=Uncinocarpus reesii (strain UAMH 1704) TaxID=336963 RepID=C4JDC5_UNCRE|nr:uncharacterized protein UREG_00685 [Uncinocarpus reesii 1704]EEP75838.1 predicted protein [Uncinocarpus reesii 1704]